VIKLPKAKRPVIDGVIPRRDEIYSLDDEMQLQSEDLKFNGTLKIADEYCHYPHCKWAVIEYKSKSLSDSIDQIVTTTQQLAEMNRKVDHVIIVAEKINNPERNLFTKRGNLLIYKPKKKPVTISTVNGKLEVKIYYPHEIEKQYKEYGSSLGKWQYK